VGHRGRDKKKRQTKKEDMQIFRRWVLPLIDRLPTVVPDRDVSLLNVPVGTGVSDRQNRG